MSPPRWFWVVVAVCLVVLTVALVLRLRLVPIGDGVTLDVYRGRACTIDGCVRWPSALRRMP